MTPKEKAEELFTKFSGNTVHYDSAKQCALIAVDEILNQDAAAFDVTEREYHFGYWYNVKEEIEKL